MPAFSHFLIPAHQGDILNPHQIILKCQVQSDTDQVGCIHFILIPELKSGAIEEVVGWDGDVGPDGGFGRDHGSDEERVAGGCTDVHEHVRCG